jgi:adenosylhomocysteine nucleosidase
MLGIIAAMQEEIDYLIQHLEAPETITIAGHVFLKGKINQTSVVVLKCGIGKVNAAMGTTLLIERFKPMHIINSGSAAGLHDSLKIGDVVISTQVRHHDVDLTPLGCEHGQILYLPAAFDPHSSLIEAATRAANRMQIPVKKGLIVSGDSFIYHETQISKIKEKFANVYAVEMEAAAVAQVCYLFDIPFVIIRALSDVAGNDSPVTFLEFLAQAGKNSAQLILYTLEELKHQ